MMQDSHQYKNYNSTNASSTVTVCTGPCQLHLIQVNKTSAQAVTIAEVGPNDINNTIGILVASISEQSYFYDICTTGNLKLTFPASYVGDITVAFSPL